MLYPKPKKCLSVLCVHEMTYNTQKKKCIFVIKFLYLDIMGSLHVRNLGQFLMRSILQAKEDPSPLNTNIL